MGNNFNNSSCSNNSISVNNSNHETSSNHQQDRSIAALIIHLIRSVAAGKETDSSPPNMHWANPRKWQVPLGVPPTQDLPDLCAFLALVAPGCSYCHFSEPHHFLWPGRHGCWSLLQKGLELWLCWGHTSSILSKITRVYESSSAQPYTPFVLFLFIGVEVNRILWMCQYEDQHLSEEAVTLHRSRSKCVICDWSKTLVIP